MVSVSPHGEPEGLVLEDGSFVKVPPHTVLLAALFQPGRAVEIWAEKLTDTPNPVYHHAVVSMGGTPATADPADKAGEQARKERHRRSHEGQKLGPGRLGVVQGKVVAVGCAPDGRVDRLLLESGASAHIPTGVGTTQPFKPGDEVEIAGEIRSFPLGEFIKVSQAVRTGAPAAAAP